MAEGTLIIDGLDELIGNVHEASATIQHELGVAMSQSVNQIKNDAQNLAPYITGTLRRSIYTDIQDNGLLGIVAQDPAIAPYGIYIEFGTGIFVGHTAWKGNIPDVGWRWIKGMPAQPYLLPAFDKNVEIVQQFFQDAVNRIFQKMGGQT